MRGLAGLIALWALSACNGQPESGDTGERDAAVPASDPSPAAVVVSAAAGKTSGVDCGTGEEPIFSCRTGGGKRIAVCAIDPGKVEYRYGAATPELILDGGRFASVPYSGGGEAQIAFANGPVRYVVFSRMIRTNFEAGEPNYPAISDGVIVLRNDEVLAISTCDDADAMPVQYDAAQKYMKQRDELFTYETGRADPTGAE